MENQPTSSLLTSDEVAERLRLHRKTIATMCVKRVFPGAYRSGLGGGHWRIPVEDVDAYEESRRQSAATHSAALNPTMATISAA